MLKSGQREISFLDCTLRDGGYYTNWDFDPSLVDQYFTAMNNLPVDYVEIGYRSKPAENYAGEFYFLPLFVLEKCKTKTDKKLAVILNEKDIKKEDLIELLRPCKGIVELIRLAVAPANINRALELAGLIKDMEFGVSFNLMYASEWQEDLLSEEIYDALNNKVDFFYVVDSFGGMYPSEISGIFSGLKRKLNIKLGFHGHNNLEMSLVNSLAAMENGADIIDATICGMGRGAGNLKTELLLTVLHKKYKLPVDFDSLNTLTESFLELKRIYNWGTSLPYMVSGAFSLPQGTVVSQVKKRYFSLNSIVKQVTTGTDISNQHKYPLFESKEGLHEALIVGGGNTPERFSDALIIYLSKNPDTVIIHSSSKNVKIFEGFKNLQIHCLPGKEAERLDNILSEKDSSKRIMVIPPYGFIQGHIPEKFQSQTKGLKTLSFSVSKEISATAMAMEIAKTLSVSQVLLTGFDGYEEDIKKEELELFEENELIFKAVAGKMNLMAITPTYYSIPSTSIFSLL
ncbi:MAG: aldolase catalytic domain-containing protein [Bacteroidota bacterium]